MDKHISTKPTNNNQNNTTLNKGDCDMAVLAKPSNIITMLDKNKIKKFMEESEKNMVDSDFLKKCKESKELLRGRKFNSEK